MIKSTKVADYHDFTTIKTSVWTREKLDVGDIWINAAVCGYCKEHIRSRNRRDYRHCGCGKTMVDGGSWYAKRGGDNYTDNIVLFKHQRPPITPKEENV